MDARNKRITLNLLKGGKSLGQSGTGIDPTPEAMLDRRLGISVKRDFSPVRRVLLFVTVSGPSMIPALRHGDVLLAVRTSGRRPRVRGGDVVLARFRSLPQRLVVKRVVRSHEGGWWLASDNTFAGGDSDSNGVADVVAKVLLRVRPGRPRRIRHRKH